ncbi:hypothetical protein [Bacteroides sp. UBA939]|uniref:hypothetical protein n=1 Tax=Bacteroides sp. UBA939 TaxID=1946092 RepID=UPI0025BB173A|nr:hypothetical protein [Bacteroides sp. UBA939]
MKDDFTKHLPHELNYYICDNITWKESLSLLKEDKDGQRIYSNLWQMTRDVLMLSVSLNIITSLVIFVAFMIQLISDSIFGTGDQTESMPIINAILISIICPASVFTPFFWALAYFGWYKHPRKIDSALYKFIASLPEAKEIERTSPVSYSLRYRQHKFYAFFAEKRTTGALSPTQGKFMIILPYQDVPERSTKELFEEIKGFLRGKISALFSIGPKCMRFSFNYRPTPAPVEVKQAAELLLYLMERFQLKESDFGITSS